MRRGAFGQFIEITQHFQETNRSNTCPPIRRRLYIIRDFFPKGTDFSTIANAEVAKLERLLNARPRKSLGFRSPQF
jgi:hypothetical protein